MKRLYRSRKDRMIAGVCGGVGEYLGIDPTLIRLVLLLLAIWGGGGVLAYLIAWIVIPEEPLEEEETGADRPWLEE
ncbi:MAG: PspC domain-containing protein [Chloroflexi bacterium]|nr:PspC domain-containing protein [Chloroflexota bacterium]